MKKIEWAFYEPKKTNRFIIKLNGYDAPSWLFQNYKFYNDKDKLMFETEMNEAVNFSVNPVNLFEIDSATITFVDPVGSDYHELSFDIKGLNFSSEGDYKFNDISTYKFIMEVDQKSMKSVYKNGFAKFTS